MAGDAMYWIHWVLHRSPMTSWAQFLSELFLTNLEELHYLGQFLIALKLEIRVRIRKDTIPDVYVTIRWAGQIEKELLFMSGHHADSGQGRSLPISAGGQTSREPTGFSSSPGVALQATRVQNHPGLCYRCSQPWGPSHVYAKLSMSVLLAGTEEGREDNRIESGELDPTRNDISTDFVPAKTELQHVQLSSMSSDGFNESHTMKLFGSISKLYFRMGASHYFISEWVVRQRNFFVDTSYYFSVKLGNGQRIQA
ncbi:hypothetical protein C2S52_021386 [Perilla frutescens var. hirtella]|nr:hypothetical protein C2S52_021386 [Perilla frutescens var. hirtella]